jgi:hypothetical protein
MLATGALSVINDLSGVSVYAKTGTLRATSPPLKAPDVVPAVVPTMDVPNNSRIVLALIRWDASRTKVNAGLVLSLVAERAEMGSSTAWLGDFIVRYQDQIRQALGIGAMAQMNDEPMTATGMRGPRGLDAAPAALAEQGADGTRLSAEVRRPGPQKCQMPDAPSVAVDASGVSVGEVIAVDERPGACLYIVDRDQNVLRAVDAARVQLRGKSLP